MDIPRKMTNDESKLYAELVIRAREIALAEAAVYTTLNKLRRMKDI